MSVLSAIVWREKKAVRPEWQSYIILSWWSPEEWYSLMKQVG